MSPDGILSQYFVRIPEFMFCQGLQLINVGHYINVTLWFISILLVGGAILFSLLKSFRHKAISVILPLVVLFGINYLRSFGDCGLIWRTQFPGSILDCNLVRGIIEMGLGVILAYVYEIKKESFDRYNTLVNVLGLVGLSGMFLIVCAYGNYDTLSLFLIPMIIVACVQPKTIYSKLFKRKIWSWFGGYQCISILFILLSQLSITFLFLEYQSWMIFLCQYHWLVILWYVLLLVLYWRLFVKNFIVRLSSKHNF